MEAAATRSRLSERARVRVVGERSLRGRAARALSHFLWMGLPVVCRDGDREDEAQAQDGNACDRGATRRANPGGCLRVALLELGTGLPLRNGPGACRGGERSLSS